MKESWDFPREGRHKRNNFQMPRGLLFLLHRTEGTVQGGRERARKKSEKEKIGSWVGGATPLSLSMQDQSVLTNAP